MPPKAKKSKGKKKLTGTPDVQKFKVLPEFAVLEEILKMKVENTLIYPEAVVFDATAELYLARLLNLFSQLSKYFGTFRYEPVVAKKDYRFHNTHNLAAPEPQYFPNGYNLETINLARKAQSSLPPALTYNGVQYPFGVVPSKRTAVVNSESESSPVIAIDALSAGFLAETSKMMHDIIEMIERDVGSDFSNSLTKFKEDMTLQMQKFDAYWVEFEQMITSLAKNVHARVLQPLVNLIQTEAQLTAVEESGDRNWERKQELERKLTMQIGEFTHFLFEETRSLHFPIDSFELAEAGMFFSSRLDTKSINICRHIVKDFIQVRLELERINIDRCPLEFREDKALCRSILNLASSIKNATLNAAPVGKKTSSYGSPLRNAPVSNSMVGNDGDANNKFDANLLFANEDIVPSSLEQANLQPQVVAYPDDDYPLMPGGSPGIVPTSPNTGNFKQGGAQFHQKALEQSAGSPAAAGGANIPKGVHASLRLRIPPVGGLFGIIRRMPRILSVKDNAHPSWATKRLLRDEVVELTNQLRNISRIEDDPTVDPHLAAELDRQRLLNAGRLHVDPRSIPVSRLAALGVVNPNVSFGLDEVSSLTFASTTAVRSDLDGNVTDLVQAVLAGNTMADTSKSKNLTHASLSRIVGNVGRPTSSVRVTSFNPAPSPLAGINYGGGSSSNLVSAGMAILR
eukprot:GDKJ01047784.1.p1 GENE.GDKJ01047784.1~~GDKJ01047784.1.p1  ORF type:complete len:685 (-),score=171.53 GDKJ01047784.1:386-2440(-)